MRVLVLSFYYTPDLSAGSFRASALVESLARLLPAGAHVDVITTLPNRYHSFSAAAAVEEEQPGISIFRIALPKHAGGMRDQSRAFLRFSRETIRRVRGERYDVVFATSSRLMTAFLGARVARMTHARLYLDIRDIFADTMKEVLPRRVSWLLHPLLSAVEKFTMRRADRINLVSPGFSTYFSCRYPDQSFTYFTNGVDEEFVSARPRADTDIAGLGASPLTVLYAGNIGDGQGLHTIIPELARVMAGRVQFKIIGAGGRLEALKRAIQDASLDNVEILPPVGRSELIAAYQAADVLFLHLNAYEAFKKVLPSKIFEYAALGKPIWAGVPGYAAQFVSGEITNAAVFAPCDVSGALRAFETLSLKTAPRLAFLAKYSRANISAALARDVLAVARTTH
jgi:hypothetical protein